MAIYEGRGPLIGNFLTPQMVGENIAEICARFGVPEAPLPTRFWKFDGLPEGAPNIREVMTGSHSVYAPGTTGGRKPIPGGFELTTNGNKVVRDTYRATSGMTKGAMILGWRASAVPDTVSSGILAMGGLLALLIYDHGSPTFRNKAFWESGVTRYTPEFLTTPEDILHRDNVYASNYNSTAPILSTSAFVNGEVTDTVAVTVGHVVDGITTDTTFGDDTNPLNSNAGKYYWAAFWEEEEVTNEQMQALTLFPHALASWQREQVWVDVAVIIPDAPLNPFATPGDEQATSGCDDSTGATSFNLYHSASTPVTTGDTKVTGANRLGEVVTGLTNGVPHYFAWTAENVAGESGLSAEVSATPVAAGKYTPSLVLSDSQLVGSWRIDQMNLSQPTASLRLKEDRGTRNIKLPKRNFTRELYPDASASIIGQVIPCLIGKGLRMKAFLIESSSRRFKVVDHGLSSFDDFVDEDGNAFTPDTLFLSSGEFIFTGWDGSTELFVDATATGANPVDAVAIILTDTERGASLDSSRLDTTSTGKGFGSNGARVKYVRGEFFFTQQEALTFSIGLYMGEVKDVEAWIKEVSAASFSTVFINRSNIWQIKAWEPEISEDLDEIRTIVGKPKYTWKMDSPVTRVVALYAKQHGPDNSQAHEFKDDWLRQLRNLSEHASKEVELPLSDLFSATYWAQRTVATRGIPRRVISFQTTQEHKELEIGDFFRLVDDDLNLDTVFEAITVSTTVGENPVKVTAIDVRGFGDTSGFWEEDVAPDWDDTWTDAEVIERRENSGFWTNEGEYADTTDAERSWRNSRWI